MFCDEEMYVDILLDVDIVLITKVRVIWIVEATSFLISDSESDEKISLQYDWSEVDFGPEFHTSMERSGLQSPRTQNIMSMCLGDDTFNLLATEANLY